MPPKKRKADNSPPPQSKKKVKNDVKKKDSERVEWGTHDDWTERLLQLLIDNPKISHGLFGGTTGERTKGTPKIHHHRKLADLLWDCAEFAVNAKDRQHYLTDKEHHVKALANRIAL
jgi:hypothetical protein